MRQVRLIAKYLVLWVRGHAIGPAYSIVCLLIYTVISIFLGRKGANHWLKFMPSNAISMILRLSGASLGVGISFSSGLTFHNCKGFNNLTVGDNCHIGKNCFFDLREEIILEDNVVVAMNVSLITHLDMTNSGLSKSFPAQAKRVRIQKNSYIGAGAIVLMGVDIEDNVVVGAGALVNKNLLRNCIYVGNPVRLLKSIGFLP